MGTSVATVSVSNGLPLSLFDFVAKTLLKKIFTSLIFVLLENLNNI